MNNVKFGTSRRDFPSRAIATTKEALNQVELGLGGRSMNNGVIITIKFCHFIPILFFGSGLWTLIIKSLRVGRSNCLFCELFRVICIGAEISVQKYTNLLFVNGGAFFVLLHHALIQNQYFFAFEYHLFFFYISIVCYLLNLRHCLCFCWWKIKQNLSTGG